MMHASKTDIIDRSKPLFQPPGWFVFAMGENTPHPPPMHAPHPGSHFSKFFFVKFLFFQGINLYKDYVYIVILICL